MNEVVSGHLFANSRVGKLKVLMLEDNPTDAELIERMLRSGGLDIATKRVATKELFTAALDEFGPDIVLVDFTLPNYDGLSAIKLAKNGHPELPIIVVTGALGDEIAVQLIKAGADDYVLKDRLARLPSAVEKAIFQVTERRELRLRAEATSDELAHSAQHDSLTGLPNRLLVNDRIGQAIAQAKRSGSRVAVLFLDLDGFKHINDSLGHSVGDKLLRSVAERLGKCLRGSDTISRQGGDEFMALLAGVRLSEDAVTTARRMLDAVGEVHSIEGHDLHVTGSIGVSVYPDDGLDAETLIKNADTAMYDAKNRGRNGYRFFEPFMNARAVERQTIGENLEGAIARAELTLHYQPKVSLTTGAIIGVEALLRWTSPRGSVSPAQFVPVAEDCGLIVPIGAWVLRMACEQAQAWIASGLPAISIAVNVSAVQLRVVGFLDDVVATLRETGLDRRSVEVELTERVFIEQGDSVRLAIAGLRQIGVSVALDDFGTGYSSLSYLQRFPVDALKIDQSFVRLIGNSASDDAVVVAVIAIGKSLNLRVIAEGVETVEQVTFLCAHRCDEAQGYYFSRPVPAAEFATLLKAGIPDRDGWLHR